MDTTAYDQKLFDPVDLFDDTTNPPHFDTTNLSVSPSNNDLMLYSMYGSTCQHPLDIPSKPIFYQSSSVPTSISMPNFLHDYHLPSSSPSDLTSLDHHSLQPQLDGNMDDLYGPCPQSSPPSYLQYLQQSPLSSQQQSSKAITTPLDILEHPSAVSQKYHQQPSNSNNNNMSNNNNNSMLTSNHFHNDMKQSHPPASSIDLNHLAMDPPCASASLGYLDTNKSSSCQWMMDSLDTAYIPTLDSTLSFTWLCQSKCNIQ
ncbi:uncharacterized protein BX664DRAFT_339356 [Halteromyces radiatus]|uniref:uncharacterized protein n=1 Tax=Halteromyces radiatus TaxID=101107 RepID=UPI00221FACCE|nr:uncharacterized protein BX664DRAFT_339356 [Halteromyces radiatus]KAI8082895.1 hypothetical protein BX664DRAFT_339356 [Halteromyces radiatus]